MNRLLLILLIFPLSLMAQTPSFEVSLDSSSARIGTYRKLKLKTELPAEARLVWPEINDTLSSSIDVVTKTPVDTLKKNNNIQYNQVLTIIAFDTGYLVIPPITLLSINSSGDTSSLISSPLLLHVSGLDIDTTLAIKDIKEPLGAPYTLRELLPYIGVGLGILAVIFLSIYLIRRILQKKKHPDIFVKPKEAAHITALRELEKLKADKLWEKGEVKKYYTRLTDILRAYIENGLGIPAIEMTSAEIIHSLHQIGNLEKSHISGLNDLLTIADMVKFAKATPLPDVHDRGMNTAVEYIKYTSALIQQKNVGNEN